MEHNGAQPSPAYWWVTQGDNYNYERELGCIFASKYSLDGRVLASHEAVMQVRVGDVIFHSVAGELRAIGRITGEPVFTYRPYDNLPDYRQTDEGYYAPVHYHELTLHITVNSIPEVIRKRTQPPFDVNGMLRQQYISEVSSTELVEYLRQKYFKQLSSLVPAPKPFHRS